MSYDYSRSLNKVGSISEYSGVDYGTVQTHYSNPQANSMPEVNKEFYGYGGSLYNDYGYTANEPQVSSNEICKHTNYGDYKTSLKRKHLDVGANRSKKPETIPEYDQTGKLVIFVGRDLSYPDALNSMIHPAQCDLCNMKMNSVTSAKDHYESKSHDKNITQWLTKNYADKGLPVPEVQRFYKHGPAGPDAFYCELCDLKLTSLTHAEQHYAGKRHRMVLSQSAKPSGEGFYNNEGKWVRVATKAIPKCKDNRFGIGEQFKYVEFLAKTGTKTTNVADTTTENDVSLPKSAKITKFDESDPTLFCAICRVSVTSALQMTMHLSGSKHQKKLKASGVEITFSGHVSPSSSGVIGEAIAAVTSTDNVQNSVIKDDKPDPSDLSMYRTPSGQYYCRTCNLTITNLHALEQHLTGKRHLKSQVERKALAALSDQHLM